MVEFDGITKSFGSVTILRDVTLKLAPHKIHVLLGQSGSGKSTLIRIAAGLLKPDSGTARLQGESVTSYSPSLRAELYGFMVQEGGLFPHLTLEDNVLLPAKVHGSPKEKAIARMKELSELVAIPERLWKRFPRQLSGGQRQRVALMRALILDPPILFLDEPLGALDPIVRSDLQKELKRIFKLLQKTVVIVTHDLAEAGHFADTLTLLRGGQIEQHGPLTEFLTQPASQFVTDYFRAQRPAPVLKALLTDDEEDET